MGQAQEETARVFDAVQQAGIAGHFDEDFLEDVAGVGLVAQEIEGEGEERLRMLIVKTLKVRRGGHFFWTGRLPASSLSIPGFWSQ